MGCDFCFSKGRNINSHFIRRLLAPAASSVALCYIRGLEKARHKLVLSKVTFTEPHLFFLKTRWEENKVCLLVLSQILSVKFTTRCSRFPRFSSLNVLLFSKPLEFSVQWLRKVFGSNLFHRCLSLDLQYVEAHLLHHMWGCFGNVLCSLHTHFHSQLFSVCHSFAFEFIFLLFPLCDATLGVFRPYGAVLHISFFYLSFLCFFGFFFFFYLYR